MPLIHCIRCMNLIPLRDDRVRLCTGCRLLAEMRHAVLDGTYSDFPMPPPELLIATPLTERVTYRDLLMVPSGHSALVAFDDIIRPYFLECERKWPRDPWAQDGDAA